MDPVWWDVKISGASAAQWRETAFARGGGTLASWDMKATLEELCAAGNQIASTWATRSSNRGHIGRKVAEYVCRAPDPVVDASRVEQEKRRVYARSPHWVERASNRLKSRHAGILWSLQE